MMEEGERHTLNTFNTRSVTLAANRNVIVPLKMQFVH